MFGGGSCSAAPLSCQRWKVRGRRSHLYTIYQPKHQLKNEREEEDEQGRSGSVALPRMKLVLATDAALLEAPALNAKRATTDERNNVADMVAGFN